MKSPAAQWSTYFKSDQLPRPHARTGTSALTVASPQSDVKSWEWVTGVIIQKLVPISGSREMPAAHLSLLPLSFNYFPVRAVDESKPLNDLESTPPRIKHSLHPSIGRHPLPHPFRTSPCRGRQCERRASTGVSTRAHASVPNASIASEQAITRAIRIIQHAGIIACVRSSRSEG